MKFPLIWGTTFLLWPFSFQMAYFPTHCKTMYLQFDSQFSGFIFRNKYLIYALIMICSKISMFLGISSQNKGLFSFNGGKSHPKNAQKMSIITQKGHTDIYRFYKKLALASQSYAKWIFMKKNIGPQVIHGAML